MYLYISNKTGVVINTFNSWKRAAKINPTSHPIIHSHITQSLSYTQQNQSDITSNHTLSHHSVTLLHTTKSIRHHIQSYTLTSLSHSLTHNKITPSSHPIIHYHITQSLSLTYTHTLRGVLCLAGRRHGLTGRRCPPEASRPVGRQLCLKEFENKIMNRWMEFRKFVYKFVYWLDILVPKSIYLLHISTLISVN